MKVSPEERDLETVRKAIKSLLEVPLAELIPSSAIPDSLLDFLLPEHRNPSVAEGVSRLLYVGHKGFLDKSDSPTHQFQFGFYTAKTRSKDPLSAARKLRKRSQTRKSPEAEELWRRLLGYDRSWTTLEKCDLLAALNWEIKDLFGVRVIVLSQRCKSNIARAMNLVSTYAPDRFMREANQLITKNEAAIELNLYAIHENNWLICNPPAGYLYSSPAVVQQFFDTAGTSANQEALVALRELDFELSFRASGYSSFQRNFKLSILPEVGFIFELQVRTLLEDAWAEPEHRLSYKPEKPLSESTKLMFRNYGAQLAASDDLLQIITDRWQEETDSTKSLFENAYQTYNRKEHTLKIAGLDEDLRRFYRLKHEGYLTTALSFVRRMSKTYESQTPEITIMLLLEECATMMQVSDKLSLLKQVEDRLSNILVQAKNFNLRSEGFAARFRLAVCKLAICHGTVGEDNWGDTEVKSSEIAGEARNLYHEFDELVRVYNDPSMGEHIRTEYEMEGFFSDLLARQASCKFLEAKCLQSTERVEALSAALQLGQSCAQMALVELGLAVTFARAVDADPQSFLERLNSYHKKNPLVANRLRWFALWGCNVIIYSALQAPEALSNATSWMEAAKSFIVGIHKEMRVVDTFLTNKDMTAAGRRKMRNIVDKISLQDLKILHSLVDYRVYRIRQDQVKADWSAAVEVEGAIRHRLIEICCLGEHGFESNFFDRVNNALQRWNVSLARCKG